MHHNFNRPLEGNIIVNIFQSVGYAQLQYNLKNSVCIIWTNFIVLYGFWHPFSNSKALVIAWKRPENYSRFALYRWKKVTRVWIAMRMSKWFFIFGWTNPLMSKSERFTFPAHTIPRALACSLRGLAVSKWRPEVEGRCCRARSGMQQERTEEQFDFRLLSNRLQQM